MRWRNTDTAYGIVGIATHWLIAVAVVGLFASGLWMVELTYYDPWYHRAPALHKAFGVVTALVVAARLVWRWFDGVPSPALGVRPWEAKLAGRVHGLLYLGVFAAAVSGYLIATAKGDPIDVFGWFAVPATIHDLPRQADVAGDIHEWIAYALIGLAGLHALAALKHHLLDRDDTLVRMLGLNSTDRSRQSSPVPFRSDHRREP